MPTEATFSHARAHFAALCDEAISTREPIIIRRRDAEDVALIAAAELRGLLETAHLLRPPRNADRLPTALAQARSADLPAETMDALRRELDLGEAQWGIEGKMIDRVRAY